MKNTPKSLQNAKIVNKTVLVRLDLDVPMQDGTILDDTKIRVVVPTIQHLLNNNCKVILLSHLGEPKGKHIDELSLMDVRFALGRILEKQIKFANIEACENSIKFMDFGEILILENLKYSPFETSKKPNEREEFLNTLIKLADAFVFEGYGMDYNVASIEIPSKKLPTYMGLHLEEEINAAKVLMKKSSSQITAVIGNENMNNTIEILNVVSSGKNKILLGGQISLYFLHASGVKTGAFIPDKKVESKVSKIIKNAKKSGCEIVLPVDHIGYDIKDNKKKPIEISTQQIENSLVAADIGAKTLISYREIIESAEVVIWQGTVGEFVYEQFNKGTESIGEYIALSTSKDCYKVAFGGNVSYAMNLLKIKPKRFNFISTNSSLFTDFIQNKESDILTLLSK